MKTLLLVNKKVFISVIYYVLEMTCIYYAPILAWKSFCSVLHLNAFCGTLQIRERKRHAQVKNIAQTSTILSRTVLYLQFVNRIMFLVGLKVYDIPV